MKNIPYTVLLALLAVQTFTGLWGGSFLLADPSGGLFQMPVEMMKTGPFSNFFIPGLALFVLLGIVPGLALYGMLMRSHWRWPQRLNVYTDQHWGWTFALYTGLMLIIWIDVQIMITGYGATLQAIYAVAGLVITILALLPAVKNRFKIR